MSDTSAEDPATDETRPPEPPPRRAAAAPPRARALDYSKWDKLAREEQEQERREERERAAAEGAGPGATAGPGADQDDDERGREEDEALARRWELPRTTAHLVRAQRASPGKADNVAAYKAILAALARAPELLGGDTVDGLIEAALRASREGAAEADEFVSAVNTLVAVRAHGAVELFSQISYPKDDASRALRLKYARKEFAKEALLERSLGAAKFRELRDLMEQAKRDLDEDQEDPCVGFCRKLVDAVASKCVVS